jgi:activator of HSP90 ATPase
MPAKDLRQNVTFKASPKAIYDALFDPKLHAKFTGRPAKIEQRQGGAFTHWGGLLTGHVMQFVPPRRIVLAWRHTGWPKGHYSIVWIELKKAHNGTRLTLEQYGIPSYDFSHISEGWKEFYWSPLKSFLAASK